VTVLLQISPDSDSEIILKIGQYLVKLTRTKNGANLLGHPEYVDLGVTLVSQSDPTWH